MYDIIIIGAGCAGLTAAIYAVRAGKTALVLECESIGGQISYSPKVENYPSIKEISGMEFSDNLFTQATGLGADFELEHVEKVIDRGDGTFDVVTDTTTRQCKRVIIASGTKHRHLGIDTEEAYAGRGVSYCTICDGAFYRDRTCAIVGGGSSALQGAELLSGICEKVYLIHRRTDFRGEAALAKRLEKKENVEFMLPYTVSEIGGEKNVSDCILENRENGEKKQINVDGIFISVGQVPQNEIFADLVELDEYGYIKAGEDCRTSHPGIFAAGDCRTKSVRQLTTAAADGSVAATAAVAEI